MKTLEKTILKNAIRLLIGGNLFDNAIDIEEVPEVLQELAHDYEVEIKENLKD